MNLSGPSCFTQMETKDVDYSCTIKSSKCRHRMFGNPFDSLLLSCNLFLGSSPLLDSHCILTNLLKMVHFLKMILSFVITNPSSFRISLVLLFPVTFEV